MENPFKWRHYKPDIILLTVRYYLFSYRDLEEMMAERSLSLDHTTIYRWVQHYAPELDKRRPSHYMNNIIASSSERSGWV